MSRRCDDCGRGLETGLAFHFQETDGGWLRCAVCALKHGPLLRRSLGIAAVVGSVLLVINQGDHVLAGNWHSALLWKVPLTYAVPFIVATWGALLNSRVK